MIDMPALMFRLLVFNFILSQCSDSLLIVDDKLEVIVHGSLDGLQVEGNKYYVEAKENSQILFQLRHAENETGLVECAMESNPYSIYDSNRAITRMPSQFLKYSRMQIKATVDLNGRITCFFQDNAIFRNFTFHFFVWPQNGTFFVPTKLDGFSVTSSSFKIPCIAMKYDKNVHLLMNGNITNFEYDPMIGFKVQNLNITEQKVFECWKDNENLKFLVGPKIPFRAENATFEMKSELTHEHFFEVRCEVHSDQRIDNVDIRIQCPQPYLCFNQEEQNKYISSKSQATSFYFHKWSNLNTGKYVCQYSVNDSVVQEYSQFVKFPSSSESWMSIAVKVLGFILLVVVIVMLFVRYVYPRYIIRRFRRLYRTSESSRFELDDMNIVQNENSVLIGKGNFSTVSLAELREPGLGHQEFKDISDQQTHTRAAVKRAKIAGNRIQTRMLKNEVDVITRMEFHENVVHPYGYETARITLTRMLRALPLIESIYLPYYERGSLKDCLRREDFVPTPAELASYGWQLARAVEHLKRNHCIHRDIALRNILLVNNGIIKLCDFGLSYIETGKPRVFPCCFLGEIGMPYKWLPLEAINGIYSYRSDAWMFGMALYEIFSRGEEPYDNILDVANYLLALRKGRLVGQPRYCPDEIYFDVIQKCNQKEDRRRIAIEESRIILENYMKENYNELYLELTAIQATEREQKSSYERFRKQKVGKGYIPISSLPPLLAQSEPIVSDYDEQCETNTTHFTELSEPSSSEFAAESQPGTSDPLGACLLDV